MLLIAAAVAAAAARPSQAKTLRASIKATREVDFLYSLWRGVPEMKALWRGPQRKHDLSHNSATNVSTKPHVPLFARINPFTPSNALHVLYSRLA